MSRWHLHTLNARNALTRLLSAIRAAGNEAVDRASAIAPLPPFDLVVRGLETYGPSRKVIDAATPAPGLIEISFDPRHWDRDRFLQTLLREIHHVMRWEGPGPGTALGEVLVSRGLADHFIVQVLGTEAAKSASITLDHGLAGRALREWGNQDFDETLWFKGGGDLPAGAGQALARALIEQHIQRNIGTNAANLAVESAEALRVTLRAMAVSDEMRPKSRTASRNAARKPKTDTTAPKPAPDNKGKADLTEGSP